MKRFNIVVAKDDGGVEVYPMKEWLRQHPEHVPPGLDATGSTSHQLRNGLKKHRWRVQELSNETRLFLPTTTDFGTNVEAVLGAENEDDESASSDPAFALEHHLRDFMAQNLNAITVQGEHLSLYVDPAGVDGVEYPTAVGPIDILARDSEGVFFVFELKRGRGADKAVGQLLRYMGWVMHTIGRDTDVKGVIVAKAVDDKLRYAASVIPTVSLLEYEVDFRLKDANVIEAADARRPG